MSILKYKDPKTGEFKRINPYKADLSFVGKDGITINKAADSEKIEISGSGCVQNYTVFNDAQVYIAKPDHSTHTMENATVWLATYPEAMVHGSIPIYHDSDIERPIPKGVLVTGTPTQESHCANKKYVDEADKDLRLKLSNLEQALNGYILDTTKESYADLDSAVLKNSVAVGENVYPIADKTRALVTRIEGKTTKMVQVLDKSTYYGTNTNVGITATNNGDGSWTINGTATAYGFINFLPELSLDGGHKVLLTGNKTNSAFTLELLNQGIIDRGNGAIGDIRADIGKTFGIAWESGAVINNVTITPQLFDLTAMNREDITTVEQFKAEFPDLYPYENGNIYPAKIGGVKFYEKQDKSGEQASVTLPETYDLHGIGDYKDYLEITKNEDNELYTLKKVQVIDKHIFDGTETVILSGYNTDNYQSYYILTISLFNVNEGLGGTCNKLPTAIQEKNIAHITFGIRNIYPYLFLDKETYTTADSVKAYLAAQYTANDPLIIYYIRQTPVETVIATNLTYEQVTAIRHNGGLIEVEGNTNKAYARPTVTNTVVYRLTAANTTEG